MPRTGEDQNLIVVEGLITDQPRQSSIKLTLSMPLGGKSTAKPLPGCAVSVSDDMGNSFNLKETDAGIYVPDSTFQGVVGRSYTLNINAGDSHGNLHYKSVPVLMKPVPPIDSVYYQKQVLERLEDGWPSKEGCQIYVAAHDPENICKFYRWEFVETWEFTLPWYAPKFVFNTHCWITEHSKNINIKNTSSFSESRVVDYPLNFISSETDRLKEKYSIIVNQYSLNEEEYRYWEKLQNVVENVGSLYDLTPASIPSNITCVENPEEKVLGYFSVSALKSRRIFIQDQFRGIIDLYRDCQHAVIGADVIPPNLYTTVWIIVDHQFPPPAYRVLTFIKGLC